MNNIAKVSVAGALALGYVTAHAAAVIPTSSSAGNIFLFADVISGGKVIDAFAADTTVGVDATTSSPTFGALYAVDGNLSGLIAANTAGTTLQWAVMGGGGHTDGSISMITTNTNANLGTMTGKSGVNLGHWQGSGGNAGFQGTASLVNANTGANPSVLATSAGGAGGWDPTILTSNASNWYSNGNTNQVTGLGTVAILYNVTAPSNVSTNLVGTSIIGDVTLSANGLSLSQHVSAVPLPAAVWLLGSGLLGLAGVGRRKLAAA